MGSNTYFLTYFSYLKFFYFRLKLLFPNTVHIMKFSIQVFFKGSSTNYVRKNFQKNNISNPLIRSRRRAYHGIRKVGFSENFLFVINGWCLMNVMKFPFPRICSYLLNKSLMENFIFCTMSRALNCL